MTDDARPRLAAKARLREDRRRDAVLLLYPEAGLVLNATAAAVLRLCTGEHTVAAIVDRLCVVYATAPRATVAREVTALLDDLSTRGLVTAVA